MLTTKKYLFPMILIGLMFFVIGFALGINSYLIPLLSNTLGVSSGKSYLIITATFLAFLVFGYPSSFVVSRIGYKYSISLSLILFALGFFLIILSANKENFFIFLLASFVCGTGNTFLQSAVNPYITILGPVESAARRISIMGVCNKLAWPVAPVFLSIIIGKSIKQVQLIDLNLPFYLIVGFFIFLSVFVFSSKLPEINAVGEENEEDCLYALHKKNVRQFPHLILGSIALFLYIGAETILLSSIIDYAADIGLKTPEDYAFLPSIGLILGYISVIILVPRYIRQDKALVISSVITIIGSLLIVLLPVSMSMFSFLFTAFGCSLIWPAIWPLALSDLGKFTKKGASLLVTASIGGAIIPLLFGFLKDEITSQAAYWILFPCFLFILHYGAVGHKIRN